MGELKLMPGPEDRELIKDLIKLRACGEIGEMNFSMGVAGLLRCYKISQLVVGTFIVRDCGSFKTPKGDFPVVAITARQRSEDGKCPACGSGPGRWLRGDTTVTAFCVGCGCVYSWPVAEQFGI